MAINVLETPARPFEVGSKVGNAAISEKNKSSFIIFLI